LSDFSWLNGAHLYNFLKELAKYGDPFLKIERSEYAIHSFVAAGCSNSDHYLAGIVLALSFWRVSCG